jgi:catechol 2,3-dioxygenase-like lactoylglutathione lyase family enzyme
MPAPSANTFHVALYVADIPSAVAQYEKMLGIPPAKVKHDYAKFEIADPPVILSMSLGGEPGTLSHLGIRYPSTGDVMSERVRTNNAGVEMLVQENATCCYAKANKYWVSDADGVRWEHYTLLEDVEAETAADASLRAFLGQERTIAPAAVPEIRAATNASACGTPVTDAGGCCVPRDVP